MKKIKPLIVIMIAIIFIAGCDKTTERASNTISVIQDTVQKIVNNLYRIQDAENALQSAFETDLSNANDNLTYFNSDEILVIQNITNRETNLKEMRQQLKSLVELGAELSKTKNNTLPIQDFLQIQTYINELNTDLEIYINHYLDNIKEERQTFNGIGNPNVDYSNFFKVFDNIQLLTTENHFYLDTALKHFEPLNRLLVDTKVKVVTILESK